MSSHGQVATFKPSGVITLTTDFGLRDPFVGVMKGQVLRRFAAARIVDLTHEVTVHWPAEAGFWLGRSFEFFPPGTVHLAVVDPGVGTDRAIAVVEADGHVFLAPDNGLLAGVLQRLHEPPVLRTLGDGVAHSLGLLTPSATFHGRDVLAPVAAELASGRLAPADLGPTVPGLVPGSLPAPAVSGGQLTGVVVTIDHFGNLLTNLDSALLAGIAAPTVVAGGREIPLRRTYADARAGDYVALINSFGVLEIARVGASAAAGLGLARGAPVTVSPGES